MGIETRELRPTKLGAEVTYGDFAMLARRDGLSIDYLTEVFRGKIDDPREYFGPVMQGRHAAVVVGYRSVLEFYFRAVGNKAALTSRRCACGCGMPVFDRRLYATAGCRQRGYRGRQVTDPGNSPEKPLCLLGPNVTV